MSKMLSFWGKTFGSALGEPLIFKPVLHHLLDVAAVARTYLEEQPARRAREAALVGMEPDAYSRFAAFCAGLHDLGKFTRSFQAKVPDLWPTAALGPFPSRPLFEHKHWISTHRLLRDGDGGLNARLRALLPGIAPGEELPLVAAIAWHVIPAHARMNRRT